MVTIETVANRAKVSTTTVSNVINGKTKRVSEATIQRVQAIIREMEYSPNMSARALSTRNSKVVALISHMDPEKSGDFMDDPFMTRFISAVESTLREKGYYIMLRSIGSREDLQKFLANWNIDGFFLLVCLKMTICILLARDGEADCAGRFLLADYGLMVT
jgi:LacI family transcriptional regulator